MAVEIQVPLVRDVLGPLGAVWQDSQITSSALVVPAMRELEALCPNVHQIIDPDAEEMANIALASLVASTLILTQPPVANTSLGDGTISFAANNEQLRAQRLARQAKDLMQDICPQTGRPSLVGRFRLAEGRRGA